MNHKDTEWLLFSFTLPAKNQAGRMRAWRRLTGLGAVIVKSTLYALPLRADLTEQLTWLAREVEEMGGEALLLKAGPPAGMSADGMAALFSRARDADWQALEEETAPLLEQARKAAPVKARAGRSAKTRPAPATPDASGLAQLRRKLLRRAESLRSIDYFPSGRGGRVLTMLEELGRLLAGREDASGGPGTVRVPPADPADYQGKVWVTRARPYVDRLASFWLVRRFVDPGAVIEFTPEPRALPRENAVRFDMAEAEFTHAGPLTTFEAMCAAFSLDSAVPERLRAVVRAIDLDGMEAGPPETIGVKAVLDGLCALHSDDHALTGAAAALFDALLAAIRQT